MSTILLILVLIRLFGVFQLSSTVPSNVADEEFRVDLLDNPVQLSKRLDNFDRLEVSPSLSRYAHHPRIAFSDDDDVGTSGLDQSTLRQVLLVHRHGDRTPCDFGPKNPLKDEPFWKFHGSGGLTNRGKARMFSLGRIVRERYNEFMGRSVNKNQRISRSSGSLRCIESSQLFLAGFLGLDQRLESPDAGKLVWDDQTTNPLAGLWQPASVQSFSGPFDGMFPGWQCERANIEYVNVINASAEVKAIFNKFQRERQLLEDILAVEMNHFGKWFWASTLIEMETSYFPDKMPTEIMEVYDSIMEAGHLAMSAYQSTLTAKRLRSGLIIGDMVRQMNNFRDLHHEQLDGHDSREFKKLLHYSGGFLHIVALLGMLDSWDKIDEPGYSSNIVIELHQDKSEWFVRIFYMAQVPANYVELHLDRCESEHPANRCTLDRFTQLMGPYMIDSWQAWMQECGNDIAKMDPYSQQGG